MAYDSRRGVTVLFGGYTGGNPPPNGLNNETWEWNGTSWTQCIVSGPFPSPRVQHAMVYDSRRGITVLFGGATGLATESNETWEWNGDTWSLRCACGPSPRDSVGMAYDSDRGVTVLFGGYGDNNQTWEWDGAAGTWTQRQPAVSPSPRWGHAMAYDPLRRVTVLFGGYTYTTNQPFGDTWEWDGAAGTWTQRQPAASPSPRLSHGMIYDECRRVTVLFSGLSTNGGSAVGGTWEWNGVDWTQRIIGEPTPRFNHGMVYDVARKAVVVFGGAAANGVLNGETWELSCAPPITEHPQAQSAPCGQSVVFDVAAVAPAGGSLQFQWRRNGVNLMDGPTGRGSLVSGTSTAQLVIIMLAPADDLAAFDCVVSNGCGSTVSSPAALGVRSGDFNHDGIVTSQDFFDFLAAFFGGC